MARFPILRPDQQGQIDGLCAVYAVLNACRRLLDLDQKQSARLFAFLCQENPDLFPQVVWKGAGFVGLRALINSARAWVIANRRSRRLAAACPMSNRRLLGMEDVGAEWRAALDGRDDRVWIIGLGPPWNHWTVVEAVTNRTIWFFDSYGIKKRTFGQLTLDPAHSGAGPGRKTMVDYHQSVLLTLHRRRRRRH